MSPLLHHYILKVICNLVLRLVIHAAGYSIRHYHETKVDQRLESIERAVSIFLFSFLVYVVLFSLGRCDILLFVMGEKGMKPLIKIPRLQKRNAVNVFFFYFCVSE